MNHDAGEARVGGDGDWADDDFVRRGGDHAPSILAHALDRKDHRAGSALSLLFLALVEIGDPSDAGGLQLGFRVARVGWRGDQGFAESNFSFLALGVGEKRMKRDDHLGVEKLLAFDKERQLFLKQDDAVGG